jgi:thiosulfate/3-mercaptopyruvate sulfurtransferase
MTTSTVSTTVRILSVRELAGALRARPSEMTIVDARRKAAFAEGHIPGAVWIGWEQWCETPQTAGPILEQEGYWGVLMLAEDFTVGRRLSALGLSDGRPVLVYADGSETRGREGRVAWMLAYLGAADVALLDGGWSAWVKAGGAQETREDPPAPGRFAVRRQPQRRRTLADLVRDASAGGWPRFIDVRSPAEYAGEKQDSLPRSGHLPGAQLLPYGDLFDSDGRYLGHRRYLRMLSGIAEEAVAYCEVGVRASLFAMLHEAHTGSIIPVYDGSLTEWAQHPELPLE